MTLGELSMHMVQQLMEVPFVERPAVEVRMILSHLLQKTAEVFFALPREMNVDAVKNVACEILQQRKAGQSLSAILGFRDFYDLRFEVNKDVLIPRPETEFLVDYALELTKRKSIRRVLDVGAGSGTVAVTVAKHCPEWQIDALEVSPMATAVLRHNIVSAGVRVNVLEKDFFEFEPAQKYDLILSNPPYIPSEMVKQLLARHDVDDPVLALDGGPDGLKFYRELSRFSATFLNSGGILAVEHGFDQKAALEEIFNCLSLRLVETRRDYAGLDRVAIVTKQ